MSAESAGSQRRLGAVSEPSEGIGVVDGDVSQDLAVKLDTGQLQAVDELRVRHPVDTGRGVDARDPQATEVALAVTAVAVTVEIGLEDGLLGLLVVTRRVTAHALGHRQGFT